MWIKLFCRFYSLFQYSFITVCSDCLNHHHEGQTMFLLAATSLLMTLQWGTQQQENLRAWWWRITKLGFQFPSHIDQEALTETKIPNKPAFRAWALNLIHPKSHVHVGHCSSPSQFCCTGICTDQDKLLIIQVHIFFPWKSQSVLNVWGNCKGSLQLKDHPAEKEKSRDAKSRLNSVCSGIKACSSHPNHMHMNNKCKHRLGQVKHRGQCPVLPHSHCARREGTQAGNGCAGTHIRDCRHPFLSWRKRMRSSHHSSYRPGPRCI